MKSVWFVMILFLNIYVAYSQQTLFINELMAKNDSYLEDDKGNFSDWIEIYNSSNNDVNIGGYYLTDDMDTLNMWKIPNGTTISAKGYLIFWASGDNINRHTNFKLGVTGETIALVMPDGLTVTDTVKFPEQTTNVSYGRTTDAAKTWIFFEQPTPNAANVKPDSDILPVLINELMASNSRTIQDETGSYPDWFELYNNSDNPIDISGFYLTDKPKREPSMWRIPNGTIMEPRGFLLIWADSDPKDDPYHTNFNLGKDGDSIAIFSVDGKTLVDMITYKNQQPDISYGRKTDADNAWVYFNIPTPGKTNNVISVEDTDLNFMITCYPNPVKDLIIFDVNLSNEESLLIDIMDINGNYISKLNQGRLISGNHKIKFFTNNIVPGTYFYNMKVNNTIINGKFIVK